MTARIGISSDSMRWTLNFNFEAERIEKMLFLQW